MARNDESGADTPTHTVPSNRELARLVYRPTTRTGRVFEVVEAVLDDLFLVHARRILREVAPS